MPKRISANPSEGGGYRKSNRGSNSAPGGTGRSVGLNIVLFILIAGLMGAGWYITLQAEQVSALASQAAVDNQRLERLELRSTETDSVMSETGKSTGQKIDLWEDEIRKLWDVTNKRNKKWINENQSALKKHTAALAGINANLKSIKGDLSRHDSAIGLQQDIQDSLTSVDLRVRQVVSQQRDIIDQANATGQVVAKLEAGLAKRVKENERAIVAIDAYRLQLNSRLAELTARLEGYSSPAL